MDPLEKDYTPVLAVGCLGLSITVIHWLLSFLGLFPFGSEPLAGCAVSGTGGFPSTVL
jgi:hypothetical protein